MHTCVRYSFMCREICYLHWVFSVVQTCNLAGRGCAQKHRTSSSNNLQWCLVHRTILGSVCWKIRGFSRTWFFIVPGHFILSYRKCKVDIGYWPEAEERMTDTELVYFRVLKNLGTVLSFYVNEWIYSSWFILLPSNYSGFLLFKTRYKILMSIYR